MRLLYLFIGLLGGVILALMIYCNGIVARQVSPLFSSWIAHLAGAIVAYLLSLMFMKKVNVINDKRVAPLSAYLGGIPGAMTVILASITTNSILNLSGTIVFTLTGQIIFTIISDKFGLFGIIKQKIDYIDYLLVAMIVIGSFIVVLGRYIG